MYVDTRRRGGNSFFYTCKNESGGERQRERERKKGTVREQIALSRERKREERGIKAIHRNIL